MNLYANRIARKIQLIAYKLIEAGKKKRREEYALKLKKVFKPEEIDGILDEVMRLLPPKKEQMAVYWILNRTLELPKDARKLDIAFQILERKKDDFMNYNSPEEVMERSVRINRKITFDPDKVPAFSRKRNLGNGIVVYNVEDTHEGLLAVREAIDAHWGEKVNSWCLTSRNVKLDDEEKELVFDLDDLSDLANKSLDGAWTRWQTYDAYPKRIAFKNGKLFAFCASSHTGEQKWWDRFNKETHYLEGVFDGEGYEIAGDYVNMMKDPLVPVEILADFYDAEEDIRLAVAENKRTPVETLEILADDEVPEVAEAAQKTLGLL